MRRPRRTSLEARASLKPIVTELQQSIIDQIKAHGPQTCEQLEYTLNLKHQTCSGQITKMVDELRVLRDSGKVKKNVSGRNAVLWEISDEKPPATQLDLIDNPLKNASWL